MYNYDRHARTTPNIIIIQNRTTKTQVYGIEDLKNECGKPRKSQR
jgi:hypothetical protein